MDTKEKLSDNDKAFLIMGFLVTSVSVVVDSLAPMILLGLFLYYENNKDDITKD